MYKFINLIPTPTFYKMTLIVREDLKMSSGKIASQCAHAAVELYKQSSVSNSNTLNLWVMSGQPKIVLKVSNEETMLKLYEDAKNKGLATSLVYDAGRTQIKSGSLTVLGIGPDTVKNVDSVTKNLKLL